MRQNAHPQSEENLSCYVNFLSLSPQPPLLAPLRSHRLRLRLGVFTAVGTTATTATVAATTATTATAIVASGDGDRSGSRYSHSYRRPPPDFRAAGVIVGWPHGP